MKFFLQAQLLVTILQLGRGRTTVAARYARLAMVGIEIAIVARSFVGFDRRRGAD
jgi:hypothetical protein